MGQATKEVTIKGVLTGRQFKKQLQIALGPERQVERYLRGVLTAIALGSDELKQCTPNSIAESILTSAQLDIVIDAKGHGYLVPFWSDKERAYKAQFVPGYKGYIAKARESSKVDVIFLEPVYRGDLFDFQKGAHPDVQHKPNLDSQDYGEDDAITYVYAIVMYVSGRFEFEVMTRAQVDKLMPLTKDGKPRRFWRKHYGEMARKTPMRRLAKKMQLPELEQMAEIDQAIDDGHRAIISEGQVQIEQDANRPQPEATEDERKEILKLLADEASDIGWTKQQVTDLMIGMFGKNKVSALEYNELKGLLGELEHQRTILTEAKNGES